MRGRLPNNARRADRSCAAREFPLRRRGARGPRRRHPRVGAARERPPARRAQLKYHRPRGIVTAGPEEPCALVDVTGESGREPNRLATTLALREGLEVESQNRWPSLRFDLRAVNDRLSRFLAAGFYYKTFMAPGWAWERVYEPLIRRAAGLGRLEPRVSAHSRAGRDGARPRRRADRRRRRRGTRRRAPAGRDAACVCCSPIRTWRRGGGTLLDERLTRGARRSWPRIAGFASACAACRARR